MVDKITDIEEWKTNYPFLNDLWASYDEFDRTVQYDENLSTYETVCHMFLNRLNDHEIEHNNFCKKILRNLGHYSNNPDYYNFTPESCNNLNYWVYNSMKKHGIPEQIIIDVFEEYSNMLKSSNNNISGCSYHSYGENYDNPMIAIMLNIFDSNISDIQKTLMNKALLTYIPGHKFVCECFKIYKDRHSTQCLNIYPNNIKQKNTCDKLNTFRNTYGAFLLGVESLVDKIPSFNNIEREYETKCKLHEQIQLVVPRVVEVTTDILSTPYTGERRSGSTTSTPVTDDIADTNLLLTPKGEEITGSSISSTISTAVGTMAGASSVLALLYKFTPGRKWIHSGFRGGRGRTSSNLYGEVPNELLFDGMEHSGFNSYNIGYEAI